MSSKQPTPLEERLGKIAVPYGLDLTGRVDRENRVEEDSNMKCEDCKYWADSIRETEILEHPMGQCRIKAPSIVQGQLQYGDDIETLDEDSDGMCGGLRYFPIWEGVQAVWPVVFPSDWCGEFQDRRKPGIPKGSMCQMCGGSTGYEKAMLCDKCRERGPRL